MPPASLYDLLQQTICCDAAFISDALDAFLFKSGLGQFASDAITCCDVCRSSLIVVPG